MTRAEPIAESCSPCSRGTRSITSRLNNGNCIRGLKQQRQKGSVSFALLSSEKPNPNHDAGGCLQLLEAGGGLKQELIGGSLHPLAPAKLPSEKGEPMPLAISSAADSKVLIKMSNLGLMVPVSLGTQHREGSACCRGHLSLGMFASHLTNWFCR